MQIIDRQVAELVPYENNTRHNEDAVKFVKASIQQFGFKVPIVISPENVIIAGHTRVLAAKELGMETVPCVIADDLTEEQMKAFRLADNKVSEASGWDWDKLDQELAEMYGKVFPCQNTDMVVVKDIEAFSYCEHHLALIYNMKISVAYLPEGQVIGLSKIARIVDMCCKRLQLQERIGQDIADVLTRIVGPHVCVRIEANHSCMTARGIKKPGSKTVTVMKRGLFNDPGIFSEFLRMLH